MAKKVEKCDATIKIKDQAYQCQLKLEHKDAHENAEYEVAWNNSNE
jgi:hypothetical protein